MSLFKGHQGRIDIAIDRAHNEIEASEVGSTFRKDALEELKTLEEIKAMQAKSGISKDTLFVGGLYAGLTLLVVGIDLFGHSMTFTKVMTNLAFRPKI